MRIVSKQNLNEKLPCRMHKNLKEKKDDISAVIRGWQTGEIS